jgi:hypothetical protein
VNLNPYRRDPFGLRACICTMLLCAACALLGLYWMGAL